MFKLPHTCTHLNASKVMLKILQARFQQYMNSEFPDVQAGFRKGRGTTCPPFPPDETTLLMAPILRIRAMLLFGQRK